MPASSRGRHAPDIHQLSLFAALPVAVGPRPAAASDAWLTSQDLVDDVEDEADLLADAAEARAFRNDTAPVEVPPPSEGGSRTRRLEDIISASAGVPVRVVITDNRHTLLSWKRVAPGSPTHVVRAHHMFLDAPEDVARAVGHWMVRRRNAGPAEDRLLDRFMAAHRHLVTRDRRPLVDPRGRHHDLQAMFDAINVEEFGGRVDARIGWGEPGAPRRRRRRSIQLGCYDPEARTISIHPAMDQAFVPDFFVASVVFHEMLHEQIPAEELDERRCVHGPAFKRREEAYRHFLPSLQWQKLHLQKLLRYRAEPSVRRPRR